MVESERHAFNEIVVGPLTKDNSKDWFEAVENYLTARDLWNVVDGTFERPSENDEDEREDFVRWKRMNAAALHAMRISCTPELLSNIRGVSGAKEAWHILQDKYTDEVQELLLPVDGEEVHYDVGDLYKAICTNNWGAARAFIEEHGPSALNARLDSTGRTALHLAAWCGHGAMVQELVALVPSRSLQTVDANWWTPLAYVAAYGGDKMIDVAECMINRNPDIPGISTLEMLLPVALAFAHGHKQMGRYLYSLTSLEWLKPEQGTQGPLLLYWCFMSGDLGVALDLLKKCEELLFAETPWKWTPIGAIARMPSAFPKLVFWKRWIYNYINISQSIKSINFVRVDIHQETQNRVPGIKEIYEVKLMHAQAAQILRLICKMVFSSEALFIQTKEKEALFRNAVLDAVKEGNFEFATQVTKANPLTILYKDNLGRHIFINAVKYRQPEVFNFISETHFKNSLVLSTDRKTGNTILHEIGMLAPSFQLNRISGTALQMQSELQWFKEVESVVHPGFRIKTNIDGMKAEDIFKESHKELRKEGEKWMKATASLCSIVGALVVTIMFTAAFTVPGGNNQDSGFPIFLDHDNKSFMLFLISDALSLFSSTTSVLMFLGILTSRYAEDDFLKSLPTKLILGLSTLFISIATMMIAFSTAVIMMLKHRPHSWILPLIIMFASVPVSLFVLLQFPLLVRMVSSTYGPSIFKKNVRPK